MADFVSNTKSQSSGSVSEGDGDGKTTEEGDLPPPSDNSKCSKSTLNKKAKKERLPINERSKVWKHFTKYDNPLMKVVDGVEIQVGIEKRAQCKYCDVNIKCDSRACGISSLTKHINNTCKEYPGREGAGLQPTLSSSALDPSKTMVTQIWSQEACVNAACVMIILDELPFSFIERPGFIQFCKVAVPKWISPCRKIIVKNCLRMYDAKKIELSKQLRSHFVYLTTDTWTSCQNINYMVITAHFIDGSWTMHKRVLNFCVIPNHSGVSIGRILERCLIDWRLDKVLTISVDNASANKVAIQYLIEKLKGRSNPPMFERRFMHVRCLAHILNLIVKSGLHMMNTSFASIRNAIRYVRSSPQRLEAFKACTIAEHIPCKKICVLDVPTRWNSTYLMLDTALKLKNAFNRLDEEEDGRYRGYFEEDEDVGDGDEDVESRLSTHRQKKRVGPLVESDWEKASIFVKYLKVFLESTLDISGQLTPTAHKAFINIATIKAEVDEIWIKPISEDSSETDKVLHSMANKMRMKFKKYFESVDDVHQLILIALILDPRRKLKYVQHVCLSMLSMCYEDTRKQCDILRSLLLELCDIYAADSALNHSNSYKRKRDMEDGISNSSHSCMSVCTTGKRAAMLEAWNKQLENEAIVVGGEVDRYLLDPIENPKNDDHWDLLEWWKCNGSKYPNLQSLAKDVLAIQVSTVASESSFSTGKRVIDPHRSSLSPKTVEALICLQSWLKSETIIGLECTPSIEDMAWYEDLEKEQMEEEKIRLERIQTNEEAIDIITEKAGDGKKSRADALQKTIKIPDEVALNCLCSLMYLEWHQFFF